MPNRPYYAVTAVFDALENTALTPDANTISLKLLPTLDPGSRDQSIPIPIGNAPGPPRALTHHGLISSIFQESR